MDYMSKTNKHSFALKTIIYLINENDRMKRVNYNFLCNIFFK